jgi:hypothetical protein
MDLNDAARIIWIGGWGTAPDCLRPFAEKLAPGAMHTFLPPISGAVQASLARTFLSAATPERSAAPDAPRAPFPLHPAASRNLRAPLNERGCDCVVGWSLGAWRVMEAVAHGVSLPERVILLAPFVAFCSEYNLGGRCSVTQVRYLRRWVQRDPAAALADFFSRAKLGPAPSPLPYGMDGLLEGLDRLAEDAPPVLRHFAAKGLPRGWRAIVGDCDPLLDGAAVARSLPGCRIAAGAGHPPEGLLAALDLECMSQ